MFGGSCKLLLKIGLTEFILPHRFSILFGLKHAYVSLVFNNSCSPMVFGSFQ